MSDTAIVLFARWIVQTTAANPESKMAGLARSYLSQTERVKALEHLLEKCKGPLEYAYWNVSSVTSRKVKDEILPAIRAALQGTGT